MVSAQDLVVWLKDVDKHDTIYVGGKNANLGEMIQAGFPVPGGFAITASAYFAFLKENQLDTKIKHLLGTVNYQEPTSLGQVAAHIRRLIENATVPSSIIHAVFDYYHKLDSGKGKTLVAIRSSATSEDSKDASFAGQQETFLNVQGEAALLVKIREAWASLFEARAVFYRHEAHMDHMRTGISLVVQQMVESDSSGIMFTVDPVTDNKNTIVIEAIYGLGEYIVQGKVTPDHYEIDKKTWDIYQKKISEQTVRYVKAGKDNREEKVPDSTKLKQKITDEDIVNLAKLGKALEEHYYFPQDIEWAKENGKLFIVQTRPITTIGNEQKTQEVSSQLTPEKDVRPFLVGDPASPGVGIGKVKVLHATRDISKVEKGDVLVAPYTNPDYVPAMKKAIAIVTERGGRTSHAAIVSREFGIPAVVGTPGATEKLKDGQVVTVNGRTGDIYKGSILIAEQQAQSSITHRKTATKLYVNLAEPELAQEVAQKYVDGIGLLRAEFMVAQIGVHPKKLIAEKKGNVFTDELSRGLEAIARAFYPRPIIYRATDFKTNEYFSLKGGKQYEPLESNPMLGYRGAYRYVHDPRVFNLELDAIKRVRERGFNNLHMMIPFVRTVRELRNVKKIIAERGLRRTTTFKLFMMCEIPSNVILIEEFIQEGIDGVSIGSNDLTMLVLGTDRDNAEVASEFDERDPAVLWALERVIQACNKHSIPVSICGQAPSVHPDLVEKLVRWGVTSISVSPDTIDFTREIIWRAEREILKKGER